MNVKRYVVDSLPKAVEQIKIDLGRDAVILHTKKLKKNGFLGIFGKNLIEVIAAVDSRPLNKDNGVKGTSPMVKNVVEPSNPIEAVAVSNEVKTETNNTEMNQLKQLMIKLMMNQGNGVQTKDLSKEAKKVYDRLITQGVKEDVASHIIERVILEAEDNSDIPIINEVKRHLIEIFAKHREEREISKETKIVYFVGPTGVGKTTTIAKLAAEQALKYKKNIAFITADTYRIAAVEQLKTYAEILNSPLEVVFSPQDTQQALDKLKDYDLIFMDTAGRNYNNEMYISELNKVLYKSKDSETFLVLSLTHKFEDMLAILEKFKKVKIDKILFTKFDETFTYGSILNIISMFPYKVSYITNGQNVPVDIEIFNEEKMARAILGV